MLITIQFIVVVFLITIICCLLFPYLLKYNCQNANYYSNNKHSEAKIKRTNEKSGEIYLKPCTYDSNVSLFPLDKSPSKWHHCNDAYEYTWLTDINNEIIILTTLQRQKLGYSSGFCPHLRCQLSPSTSFSTSSSSNQCPLGLCYTKVEDSSLSFGACCFTNGSFISQHLIGFMNKSQSTPKPIYNHSRIILRPLSIHNSIASSTTTDTSRDDSADTCHTTTIPASSESTLWSSFINANEVYPGIIASQCPISLAAHYEHTNDSVSTGAYSKLDLVNKVDTTQDVLHMILQENITLWLQISPYISDLNSDLKPDLTLYSTPLDSPPDSPPDPTTEPPHEPMSDLTSVLTHESMPDLTQNLNFDLTSDLNTLASVSVLYTRHITPLSSCRILPLDYTIYPTYTSNLPCINYEISELNIRGIPLSTPYIHMSYDITTIPTPTSTSYTNKTCSNSIPTHIPTHSTHTAHTINHIWYHKWPDFSVPRTEDDFYINRLIDMAVEELKKGRKVLVTCGSGRYVCTYYYIIVYY